MSRLIPLIGAIGGLLLMPITHAELPKSNTYARAPFSTTIPAKESSTEKVSLNKADAKQLVQVKGIGPKRAEAIVKYRAEHGPFRSIDDLARVRGIGTKKLAKLRPFLTL